MAINKGKTIEAVFNLKDRMISTFSNLKDKVLNFTEKLKWICRNER